jgi:two-component system sensor histidine kinase PilS (NtrC family)
MMHRIRQTKLASLGRLTANIAHEVRNPLGAISHAGQMLNESEAISSNEDKRLLEIILNHSNRVNRIIEDVLDVSRHKDVAASKIQLDNWLAKFISHYKNSSEQCDDIQFEIEPKDIELKVSSSQLERILTNLFDNGLRYSQKATGKANLIIKAGLHSGTDGGLQPFIRIIDEGPGLSEEEESHLFEPFHTTESSGTGLGLYISKELCEANQATLDYSVTKSGNSCFSIYFSSQRHKIK